MREVGREEGLKSELPLKKSPHSCHTFEAETRQGELTSIPLQVLPTRCRGTTGHAPWGGSDRTRTMIQSSWDTTGKSKRNGKKGSIDTTLLNRDRVGDPCQATYLMQFLVGCMPRMNKYKPVYACGMYRGNACSTSRLLGIKIKDNNVLGSSHARSFTRSAARLTPPSPVLPN